MRSRREFLQVAAAGFVTGWALPSRTASAESTVRSFGDAVVIAGNPRDRGRAYGRQYAEAIRQFLDREILTPFVSETQTKDSLLRYAGACMDVIRTECPIIADELEGMAEGTGLRVEEHVLLTLHEELYHRGNLPPISHCTAVAVGPKETAGSTFVGQTWDWMPSVAGLSSMVEWRREDGPSVLAYGYPGLWVGAGLNSAGLALCWTSAELGKKNQQPRVGIPSYVLLTHLLYQPSLDAVVGVAKRNRHAGWFTFVMGDGTGRLLNVEGSPERIACEEATGRLIRVGFGSREMAGEGAARHARCVSMDSLLDGTRAKTDLAAMKQNFGDPGREICVGKGTIDMMVFDTTLREAHMSRGPEYGESWRTYGFAEKA